MRDRRRGPLETKRAGTPAQPAKESRSLLGTPRRGLRRVGMRLPLSHLKILRAEAERLGMSRGMFLELLVRHVHGDIELKPSGTRYEVTREELTQVEDWAWYVRPEVSVLLDEDMIRHGYQDPRSWVITMLNQFIGGPPGSPATAPPPAPRQSRREKK